MGSRIFCAVFVILGGVALWLRYAPNPREHAPKPDNFESTGTSRRAEQRPRSRGSPSTSKPSVKKHPQALGEGEARHPLAKAEPTAGSTKPRPPAGERSDAQVYDRASPNLLARRKNGVWVTQGDVLVDPERLADGVGGQDAGIASLAGISYWDGGRVPYEIDVRMKDASHVHEALAKLNRRTAAQFRPRAGERDYVFFEKSQEDVCQSYLGRKGGEQKVLLHPSCSVGQILHELMHVLGFLHEHSRADRSRFLRVHWANIQTNRKNQFQKIAGELSVAVATPFDFDSVLLYPATAFSKNGRPTLTKRDGSYYFANRDRLSPGDVAKVEALYGE